MVGLEEGEEVGDKDGRYVGMWVGGTGVGADVKSAAEQLTNNKSLGVPPAIMSAQFSTNP